jgi:hypothetical protein
MFPWCGQQFSPPARTPFGQPNVHSMAWKAHASSPPPVAPPACWWAYMQVFYAKLGSQMCTSWLGALIHTFITLFPHLARAAREPCSWLTPRHAIKTKGCSFGMLMEACVALDGPKVSRRVLGQPMGSSQVHGTQGAPCTHLDSPLPVHDPPLPACYLRSPPLACAYLRFCILLYHGNDASMCSSLGARTSTEH